MPACQAHKNCISKAVVRAERICRDKGLRFTELRRKVLELIWASHAPAKAYAILERLGGDGTTVKPPTVYRTLNFLLEHGLIHKLDSLNAYIGCGHPLKHSECYFLCCSSCGEIKECCSEELDQTLRKVTGRNQFKSTHTTLEIKGECRECSHGA